MVTYGSQIYPGDHFTCISMLNHCSTPKTNIILYINYISTHTNVNLWRVFQQRPTTPLSVTVLSALVLPILKRPPSLRNPGFIPFPCLTSLLILLQLGFNPFLPPKPLSSRSRVAAALLIQESLACGYLCTLLSRSPYLGPRPSLRALHSRGFCDCPTCTFYSHLASLTSLPGVPLLAPFLYQAQIPIVGTGTLCWLLFFILTLFQADLITDPQFQCQLTVGDPQLDIANPDISRIFILHWAPHSPILGAGC